MNPGPGEGGPQSFYNGNFKALRNKTRQKKRGGGEGFKKEKSYIR